MAYDQNSAYEPPRRAYMHQTQQPSAAYSNEYADYAQGPYDQYSQGYSQEYRQHNHGHHQTYDQRNGHRQEPVFEDAYSGGYGSQQQGNGHYYAEEEGRSYDSRYQPRAQRGPPATQRGPLPPQQRPGPPPGPRGAQSRPAQNHHQGDPRVAARQNGQHQQPAMRQRDPYEEQNAYPPQGQWNGDHYEDRNAYHNAPRSRAQEPRASYEQNDVQPPARPQPQPQYQQAVPQPRDQKSSMEDWKAQEKAKLKQVAMSPETANFDNAFPVFGKRAQRDTNRSGGASTPSGRRSEEQGGRPSMSHDGRPPNARDNSYRGQDSVQPPARPDVDRQYSSQPAMNRPRTAHSNQHDAHRDAQNGQYQYANDVTTPVREDYPESWPMVPGQTPPKPQSQQRSPPRVNGHDPRYASNQQAYSQHSDTQTLPKQRGPPIVPPIDTSQTQQYQRPVYANQQPLSPAIVPPRPSTSQGSRPVPGQQIASPVSQYPQSAHAQDSYNDFSARSQNPWTQEQQQTSHENIGGIYDEYNMTAPRRLERAPTNREEEIEAEMPDFDSAAPAQTSSLHKRMQTVDKHLDNKPSSATPPPPTPRVQGAPPPPMPQSQSAHDLRYTQQQYGEDMGPGLKVGSMRRAVLDRPGHAPMPSSAPERQYDIPYRNSPAPEATYNQGAPLPPPQAPYASDPQVRRSMDDGRSMPYRQGPLQGQRMAPNGNPLRNDFLPNRPGFDRNTTNQTVWSDPGQERVGSAPPLQGRLGGPPGVPAGGLPDQPRPGEQTRHSHPDALPHHPTPVRAGHVMPSGDAQPSKPPPVRNYAAANGAQEPPHQRTASLDAFANPVTHNELTRLRGSVDNGQSGPKNHLILVKKLVEASKVLAATTVAGGRCDPKMTAKNREGYLNEAYKRLKKLVASGYPSAQFYMADCYGQGLLGLEPDTKEAFKLYQAAAKAGHPQAAYRTAVCCEMGPEEGGGTSRDYPKAVQWYRRAATLGDSAAMYKIGAILLKGLLGQQRNMSEAVNWLKRGAERADKDNPHALHELATLYESNNRNPEVRNKIVADDAYAKDLYMQAARLGYKFSQFRLGQAYEYGSMGLPISNRDSIAWYTKAAAQGEHQAELALSGWYLTGAPGILEHSDTEAYLWARKAASSEGGPQVGKAMFAMGYFTENGIGCPKSMEEARKWYGRAASYKFPKALERLEELRKGGGKSGKGPAPVNGRLTRKDQKRDEENCVVM